MVPWDQFDEAVQWYRERMGWRLKGVADTPVGRKAFFRMRHGTSKPEVVRDAKAKWSYVWLEQLPVGTQPVKANPGSRLYFQVKKQEDFFEAHRWLKEQGIEVSDVVGTRWQGFHFYDPDGNRLNVWTY